MTTSKTDQNTNADRSIEQAEQHVEVPVTPPRDPEAYETSDHFVQRHRERVPQWDEDLAARVLEDGRITRVPGDTVEDGTDYGTPIAFTTSIRGKPWTVIVALRPTAFAGDLRHVALTVFQGTPTQAEDCGVEA